MAYTGNPLTNPVDEFRLLLGDLDPEFPMMGDEEYIYFQTKHPATPPSNVSTAAIQSAAQSLLFYISRYTRESTGMIEVYGAQAFDNYRAALNDLLSRPQGALNLNPIPYFGNISRLDIRTNRINPDNINPAFYRGQTNNRPVDLDRKNQIERNDIDSLGMTYAGGYPLTYE